MDWFIETLRGGGKFAWGFALGALVVAWWPWLMSKVGLRRNRVARPRRVVVETPYSALKPDGTVDEAGVERNLKYLRACMADCFARGEYPYASHGLYTQPGVLRDDVPEERRKGMEAGFAWGEVADATVVYVDMGTTEGMNDGVKAAEKVGRQVEYRRVRDWDAVVDVEEETTPWTLNLAHDFLRKVPAKSESAFRLLLSANCEWVSSESFQDGAAVPAKQVRTRLVAVEGLAKKLGLPSPLEKKYTGNPGGGRKTSWRLTPAFVAAYHADEADGVLHRD